MMDDTMNPATGSDDQAAGAEPTTGDEQMPEEPAAPAGDEAASA